MEFVFNFHKGAFIEYKGEETDLPALVEFIDMNTDTVLYSTIINPNCWASTALKHYIKWKIRATINEEIKFEHILDLSGKRVILVYQYPTLGDFLFWMPVFEKFRVENNCHIIVHCTKIDYINSVQQSYPDIIFTYNYASLITEGIYAIYEIDMVYYDMVFSQNKYPTYKTPQQMAVEFLGFVNESIPVKIDSNDYKPLTDKKYVCITEHGKSNDEKDWLYPNGWQEVTDWLITKGYDVVPISYEPTNLSNVIDATGKPLKEMIQYLKFADLVIGGATGPLVVSLALGVPSIQILTNTWPDSNLPYHYVYNHTEGTCFACYTKEPKGQGDTCWFKNQIPPCSINITPDMVIAKIKEVLTIT